MELTPFSRPCPPEGSGVHFWLFAAACYLRRSGWRDDNAIFREIEAHATRTNAREIREAVRNSATIHQSGSISLPRGEPRKQRILPSAPFHREALERVTQRYGGLDTLRAVSPSPVAFWSSELLLDALFPGNPLLCVAQTAATAQTWPREKIRGVEPALPLIVPSPMSALTGVTKTGSTSARCLDNTGPRRFLVIEFDRGTEHEQAAAILDLASMAPLVLVCHSGKKSLHGWFYCLGQREELLHKFHGYAVSLGADPATWVRCQLVRMPGAVRPETGRTQELLFLHPAACPSFPPPGLCPRCWFRKVAAPLNGVTCPHSRRKAPQ